MKKWLFLVLLLTLQACYSDKLHWQEPEYNYLAAHMSIVEKNSNFVTYEYRDIRVDEVAPIAALYCREFYKQAALYEITMHRNNARRATFICKRPDEI